MFSLGGITSPCTMKLHGHIAELKLVVMIDINQTTIDKLWLHVTSTSIFEVRLEVGSHAVSRGVCHAIKVNLVGFNTNLGRFLCLSSRYFGSYSKGFLVSIIRGGMF